MAKAPIEQIRDLALELRGMTEREAALRDHLSDLKQRDAKRENEIAELRKENAELRRELAEANKETAKELSTLKQQFQDHLTQYQEWDRRRWGLIVIVFSAMLTSVVGLILGLLKVNRP